MSPLYQRVGCHQVVRYAVVRKVKCTGIANWDAVEKAGSSCISDPLQRKIWRDRQARDGKGAALGILEDHALDNRVSKEVMTSLSDFEKKLVQNRKRIET